MSMFKITVKGVTPLMLHAMPPEALLKLLNSNAGKKKGDKDIPLSNDGTPDLRKLCERHLYTDPCNEGRLVVPANMLFGAIREAGRFHKIGKAQISTRDSTILPSFFAITSPNAEIVDPRTDKPASWDVDLRRAVNEAAKVAVCAVRPRFDHWQLSFDVDIDTNEVQDQLVRDLIDTAGKSIGIGSFRPSKGGIYGRWTVTRWEELRAETFDAAAAE